MYTAEYDAAAAAAAAAAVRCEKKFSNLSFFMDFINVRTMSNQEGGY